MQTHATLVENLCSRDTEKKLCLGENLIEVKTLSQCVKYQKRQTIWFVKMKSEVFSYKMQPYLIKACKCDGVTIKNTNLDQSYQTV
jgi:propanediol utilization protein